MISCVYDLACGVLSVYFLPDFNITFSYFGVAAVGEAEYLVMNTCSTAFSDDFIVSGVLVGLFEVRHQLLLENEHSVEIPYCKQGFHTFSITFHYAPNAEMGPVASYRALTCQVDRFDEKVPRNQKQSPAKPPQPLLRPTSLSRAPPAR